MHATYVPSSSVRRSARYEPFIFRPAPRQQVTMASFPSLKIACSTAFVPYPPPLAPPLFLDRGVGQKPPIVPIAPAARTSSWCPACFIQHSLHRPHASCTHLWQSPATSANSVRYTDSDNFNAELERVSSRSSPTSPNVAASAEAESILLDALSSYRNNENNGIRPNRRSFELVMQAYMNLGRSRFQSSSSSSRQNNDNTNKSSRTRTTCAADKLAELNQLMVTLWEEEGRPDDLAPTVGMFNAVLSACAACAGPQKTSDNNARRRRQSKDGDGVEAEEEEEEVNYAAKAEHCLQQMQDLTTGLYGDNDEDGDTKSSNVGIDVRPDASSYSLLAAAWARQQPMGPRGTSWAGYERHSFAASDLQVDSLNWIGKSVSGNGAQKASGDCASKAEERLRILEAMWTESGADDIDELPYLLAEAYDDTLAAWARSGVEGSPLKAENVLRRWENLADDIDAWTVDFIAWEQEHDVLNGDEEDLSPLSLFPTAEAYTTVILAYALSGTAIGPRKAQEFLEKTLELYEEGKWGECRPDLVAWNAVISSWASRASTDSGAADEAESALNRLLSLRGDDEEGRYDYLLPDVVSWNAALSGWCHVIGSSGRGRHRSNKRSAKRLPTEGANKQREQQIQAIQRAKSLLDGMELESITNPKAAPNARTYSSLIYALTQSGLGLRAVDDATSFLYKMEDQYKRGRNECRPSLQLYSAIISAYGRCSDADAGHKALDLFHHLNYLSERGGKWDVLRPDAIIYSSVLDAIGKCRMEGGADIALDILREVESIYEETYDELCKPSVRFYTAVILVLSQCRQDGNAQRAYEILTRMEQQSKENGDENALPNSFTYNYAINCAANTLGSLEKKTPAFKVALHAFQSLRNSPTDQPNSFTYAFFIKACNSLLPLGDVRYKVVTQAFNECCSAGVLSQEVLKWFKLGIPSEIGRELLLYPDNYQRLDVRDLPVEWSCNANKRR